MKIKLETKIIELTELWFDYLFPYMVRFCLRNNIGIEWKNNIISISIEHQSKFNQMLKDTFEELVTECYKEPTQRERSKNSSRYQKIEFKGTIYILNYRTDIIGKIGYGLNYLIKETKSVEE